MGWSSHTVRRPASFDVVRGYDKPASEAPANDLAVRPERSLFGLRYRVEVEDEVVVAGWLPAGAGT